MRKPAPSPSPCDLDTIVQLCHDLSRQRKEPPTTLHLLAVLTSRLPELRCPLQDRGLNRERILQFCRTLRDAQEGGFARAIDRATELARTLGLTPTAAHLLKALLSDSGSAARRLLEQRGVDIAQLRGAAWNSGMVTRPHAALRSERGLAPQLERPSLPPSDTRAPVARAPSGVTIPLFPKGWTAKGEPEPGRRSSLAPTPSPAHAATPLPVIPSLPTSAPALLERRREALGAPSPKRLQKQPSSPFDLCPKRFPNLCQFGRNLTALAREGQLDPVIGRTLEIERLLDVLAKREGNSPILIGGAGVGKTTVVRGLAEHLVQAGASGGLDQRVLIELSVPELLAGTPVRGALAERLGTLEKELAQTHGRVILFIDEIHLLFSGETSDEAASGFRRALGRGELSCIGATSGVEYRRVIEADPMLSRRFVPLEVDEPSHTDARAILRGLAPRLESFHHVSYEPSALDQAVALSHRYLPGRLLPDKAIAVMDLAGARSQRRGLSRVAEPAIAEAVAEMADVPVERVQQTDAERFLTLESAVAERVIGHQEPISRIARILRRNAAGLVGRRPLGTFLLLGPTGVGKTETVKAFAEALFHSEHAMVRLDMAEYAEPHALARLIGAPPGYVGHDAGGQLTEAVRRRPYQIVLLDEIEKAHPEVLQAFLALFDEGRMTDGRGRTVDFTNTILMLTSNLGSEHTRERKRRVGFGVTETEPPQALADAVIASARAHLAPELYNRLDEVLVFAPLERAEVRRIAALLLGRIDATLGPRGLGLSLSPAAIDWLLDHGGYDVTLGARPLRRAIARLIEAPLADAILKGELPSDHRLWVDISNDALSFAIRPA